MKKLSAYFILLILFMALNACTSTVEKPPVKLEKPEEKNMTYKSLVQTLEKDLNNNPNDYNTLQSIGIAYYKVSEYDKAIKYLNKALKLKKDSYIPYDILGKSYEKQNKTKQALSIIDEGLKNVKLKNAKIVLLNDKGKVYENLKDYNNAMKYYKDSLNIPVDNKEDPDDVLSYGHPGELNIAKLYMKLDKDQDAIKTMQESLLFNNIDKKEAYIGLTNAFIIDKDYDAATKTINKLIKLEPNYPGGYYVLGALYEHGKNYKLAVETYNKAISLDEKTKPQSENTVIRIDKFKRQVEKLEKMLSLQH